MPGKLASACDSDVIKHLCAFCLLVPASCLKAREHFEKCREHYIKLAELIPAGQYYRYSDHWHFLTQRLVFLIALTVYLEVGFLVSRETAAEILGCKYSLHTKSMHVLVIHTHDIRERVVNGDCSVGLQ